MPKPPFEKMCKMRFYALTIFCYLVIFQLGLRVGVLDCLHKHPPAGYTQTEVCVYAKWGLKI
jgi:hypothetical protein